jgi:chaperonin GroEL
VPNENAHYVTEAFKAVATGLEPAEVVRKRLNRKGMKLEKFNTDWFGKARVITVNKDTTTVVDGKGDETAINQRIEELQKQIENSRSPFEQEKLQERLAKFIGGVAIIHVGGNTETEMKEKKDRVDDALHATKAAIEEGIVPGGGSVLLHARNGINSRENIGSKIVWEACTAPFKKILTNAGYEPEHIYTAINAVVDGNDWYGWNLKSECYADMKEDGIIDPFKVTRCALENAASIAGTVLLTECTVVDKPEDKKSNEGFGGMEGMY